MGGLSALQVGLLHPGKRRFTRVSKRAKKIALTTGGAVIVAGAWLGVTNRAAISDIPGLGGLISEPTTCPLSGVEPRRESALTRPAVAVKVENATVAYPLSGLEDAEIVYEELIEGGVTRFMAIYHCSDPKKAGPVRSARMVDPAIMMPVTKILAFSGANEGVLQGLADAGVVALEENVAGAGLVRIPREGLSLEHTLYADTVKLRKLGRKDFADPPPENFEFGELDEQGKKARSITIEFSSAAIINYTWSERGWLRSHDGVPFMSDTGEQIAVDNVLIEEHEVGFSDFVDVVGTPSPEIVDVSGSGRAVLFRDGRAIKGRWVRESATSPVAFETKSGKEMVFAPGSTWIELVPSDAGELKGSFSFEA
ncbi:MAG TPA: DUF3048 domain-containing protein [Actinomycetota bacterium]|nr:DUF3048 domain-containing protein [Actinomycetota bacterium]